VNLPSEYLFQLILLLNEWLIVYIVHIKILERNNDTIKDKRVCISGSGNVAQHAVQKLIQLGAKPITVSDSSGYIYEENGIDEEGLKLIMKIKNEQHGRIKEYAEQRSSAVYFDNKRPWEEKCDIAMPCATQNEIELEDAKNIVSGGCKAVFEGANMPSTNEAISHFTKNNLIFGPAKACNAGGVATSGLEMTQNSMRIYWTDEEVDKKLQTIMTEIVNQIDKVCDKYNIKGDYKSGANIAGFLLVADSMLVQGCV